MTRVSAALMMLVLLMGISLTTAGGASAAPTRVSASSATLAMPMAATAAKDYCGTKSTKWVPDGWGKANFRNACRLHDACYSSSSKTSRLNCDKALHSRLRSACASAYGSINPLRYTCYGVAATYYEAVRKFGRSAYHGKGSPA